MKAVRLLDEDVVAFDDTPLAFVNWGKLIRRKAATESQLHSLEDTRRLLMRVEAVQAVSWLWVKGFPSVTHAADESSGKTTVTPTLLVLVLPILTRRAGMLRVLLAALFRHSRKPY